MNFKGVGSYQTSIRRGFRRGQTFLYYRPYTSTLTSQDKIIKTKFRVRTNSVIVSYYPYVIKSVIPLTITEPA